MAFAALASLAMVASCSATGNHFHKLGGPEPT
uniref:Uncharacterized protein n=2 Tax=Oryza sativa subsp. japonica TaxID=39947 RepID=Q7G3R1_ORYSJ|nr:Hypothetical protein [Oryza sativa Japonica Group]AAN34948.1 Hypothetical protein [Oryza sativa Japonica Group]AAP53075.1 hypothetical protein LOC_Os10g18899 [Oryza sativa Japonica Group]